MEQSENRRVYFWDNFKGLLIFLVVFAHILYETNGGTVITPVLDIIYIFHMPAFVFTTGYLSKSGHSRSRESLFGLLSLYFLVLREPRRSDNSACHAGVFFLVPAGGHCMAGGG